MAPESAMPAQSLGVNRSRMKRCGDIRAAKPCCVNVADKSVAHCAIFIGSMHDISRCHLCRNCAGAGTRMDYAARR